MRGAGTGLSSTVGDERKKFNIETATHAHHAVSLSLSRESRRAHVVETLTQHGARPLRLPKPHRCDQNSNSSEPSAKPLPAPGLTTKGICVRSTRPRMDQPSGSASNQRIATLPAGSEKA